jgi:predicted transposase/invertase (TIGR01784 family)
MKVKKSTVTLEQVLEETGITARAEARAKLEVARNFVKMGVSLKKVAQATGLDIKTVKSLVQP